jgi:hypothetical protein
MLQSIQGSDTDTVSMDGTSLLLSVSAAGSESWISAVLYLLNVALCQGLCRRPENVYQTNEDW